MVPTYAIVQYLIWYSLAQANIQLSDFVTAEVISALHSMTAQSMYHVLLSHVYAIDQHYTIVL